MSVSSAIAADALGWPVGHAGEGARSDPRNTRVVDDREVSRGERSVRPPIHRARADPGIVIPEHVLGGRDELHDAETPGTIYTPRRSDNGHVEDGVLGIETLRDDVRAGGEVVDDDATPSTDLEYVWMVGGAGIYL